MLNTKVPLAMQKSTPFQVKNKFSKCVATHSAHTAPSSPIFITVILPVQCLLRKYSTEMMQLAEKSASKNYGQFCILARSTVYH